MTLAMMKKFGVEVTANWPTFLIQGHQRYRPQTLQAESDASHAAFFSLGASLRGDVMLEGEWSSLTQGDLILFSWLRSHHGNLVNTSRGYHVTQSSLQPMHVDLGNYPDLAPMLIASSAFIDGSSTFTSLARLNDKESPRFDVIKHLLTQWHVPFVATEDAITVHGSIHHRIPIGVYDTHRDHRMAMTLAMVSPFAEQSFVIQGMDCVRKSFPHFLDVYQAIGGRYEKE
jgi:3-phosphoshikimate 1-carboxyvinyltransferase